MSNKYKLLLLDVDGTTVASSAEALPSEAVIKAVQEAQKHLHVSLATGRPIQLAKPVIDAIGLHGLGVFKGGAEIIDIVSGKVVFTQRIAVANMRETVKLALPFGFKIYACDDHGKTLVTSPSQVVKPAANILITAVKTSDAVGLLEELAAVKGIIAHPASSWETGDIVDIHVTHEYATKRHSAERLMAMLDCKKEEVIAIGDGHNDIPLLEVAGFKVAMGNSPDEVKAIADYVAPSLEDDGVADAIKRFILA
jgi:hypothetical protein